jgi:hypothetical protein
MPKPASEEIRQQWKEHILKQRQSGISTASWCRQNNIFVHSFCYWRDKLFPKAVFDRSDFRELSDQKTCVSQTGITLEYREFSIHLDPQFDSSTLIRCLEVLKKC